MSVNTDPKKIEELLTRGVSEVINRDNLEKKLKGGKVLRVKFGIDPTSPNIHIGRSVPLLKLRDFQNLGHKIIFIIGDFTGVIGDTSDKDSERPMLDEETITKNLRDYIEQAEKIIDTKKCEIYHNSKWLSKLDYHEIGKQANSFSLNEFISRENIKKRLDIGKRVSLRELLYPMMQGYDSVAVKADVELGGTDQKFNLLAGRELQRLYGQEPQDIITGPLVEGLDGRKMSSSWGNTINLIDTANDMFGKVMSLKDEFIIKYFTLVTRVEISIIDKFNKDLSSGVNPKDIKIKLAHELVRFYHGEDEAQKAEAYFISTFSKKEVPTDIPKFKPEKYDIVSVLVDSKLIPSKSEARRAIDQGGVRVDNIVVKDAKHTISVGSILQKGKIHFLEIL